MDCNKADGPSWKIRRRVIIGTLLFLASLVGYLTVFGEDIRLHETIISSSFVLAGVVISGYIGGAVWDDKNFMDKFGKNK